MTRILTKGKWIDTAPIAHLITEGEQNADQIEIVLQKQYGAIDLTALEWTLAGVSEKETRVEQVLTKRADEDSLTLDWKVTGDWTAVSGRLHLELLGQSVTGGEMIKFSASPIEVRPAKEIFGLPRPDLSAQFLQTMREIVLQAQESAQMAQTSMESAANQVVEAALQAEAAKGEADRAAGIDAYTKRQSNGKFAYAPRGKASGEGLVTVNDMQADGGLNVTVQGACREDGTGDKSPDHPYNLIAAGGEARVEGQNLVSPQWDFATTTQAGITCSCYANGSFTLKGTNTISGANNFYLKRYDTPTSFSLGAGDYTLSGLPTTIPSGCTLAVYQRAEGVNINLAYINSDYRTRSFRLEQPRDNLFLVVAIGAGVTVDLAITPQLERGTVANPYTPYIAPQAFIVPELRGIPDGAGGYRVRDEQTVSAAGSVDVMRRVKALTLDGSEAWEISATATGGQNQMRLAVPGFQPTQDDTAANLVCTHYPAKASGEAVALGVAVDAAGDLLVYDPNHNTTAADFKAYLAAGAAAGHPLTVWAQLAAPVTEHIEDIDPLTALPGATALALDEVITTVAIEYPQDIFALLNQLVRLSNSDA